MLTFFTSHLPNQQKYRCLSFSLLIALLLLVITSYIHYKNAQAIAENTADTYGNTLAKLVSEQVATSALNKDSISLQATASYIASQTTVASIIIYDISHNIMAQSSDVSLAEQEQGKHYTSPIISGDNVIGSVTLNILPQAEISSSQGTYLTGAMLLLLLVIIYIKDKTTTIKPEHKEIEKEILSTEGSITDTTDHTVNISLLLQISNIDLLYQHLNGDSRSQQFDKLDNHLQQVIHLYNGKLIAAAENSFILLFTGQFEECIKHALYSGELMLKLNQQTEKSIIILNGFIQTTQQKPIASTMLNTVRKVLNNSKHQLFIDRTLLENSTLEQQLNLEQIEKSPNAIWVKGFTGSSASLLENQLALLKG